MSSGPDAEFGFLCDPTVGFGIEYLVLPFFMALLLLAATKLGFAVTFSLRSKA